MKILVLCERSDSEGGTETYLRLTLPALVAAGDQVRVVARSASSPDAYGVTAEVVEWSDEHDPPSARAAARVASIAEAFEPDVLVAHNVLDSAVLEAAEPFAERYVYHLHDHRPFCPNGDRLYPQGGGICGVAMGPAACGFHSLIHGCAYGPRPRTLRLVAIRERLATCVREADAAIVFSNYVAGLAERNGVERERTALMEPPLDDAAYVSEPSPRPEHDVVLFAGRIVPSKGARSLVRALSKIDAGRRPVLRIAGYGPDLGSTVDEAFDTGVRVEYIGRLDPEELRAAYDNATLVAVPSTWGEPFGLVGIEAFARGRPVAAYDSGGIAQWLVPDAGRLAPRGDEEALASAIDALLGPRAWPAASASAFAASQAYRLHSHVLRLRQIYAGA